MRTELPSRSTAAAALLWILLVAPASGQQHAGHDTTDHHGDSAAVADVVERFHEALASGDSATTLALLAPDARVLESGGIETLEEYAGHHLPADIAFASAVRRERGPLRVRVRGDVAWTVSASRAYGSYRGRAVDARVAELMVLARDPSGSGWRIEAIHWSSRSGGG